MFWAGSGSLPLFLPLPPQPRTRVFVFAPAVPPQVLYHQDGDLEDLAYDQEEAGGTMAATFHDMGQLEARGSWARFW